MRTRTRTALAAALVLAAAVVATWLASRTPSGPPTHGMVVKVFDGDTILVAAGGRHYKVRLIGVDTPEAYPSAKLDRDARRSGRDRAIIMALGRRASEFTRSLCQGKECRLAYDRANAHTGHRDRYGRLLAYVYVSTEQGELLLEAEILRAGYGAAIERFPYDERLKGEFRRLGREARRARRGLWGGIPQGHEGEESGEIH